MVFSHFVHHLHVHAESLCHLKLYEECVSSSATAWSIVQNFEFENWEEINEITWTAYAFHSSWKSLGARGLLLYVLGRKSRTKYSIFDSMFTEQNWTEVWCRRQRPRIILWNTFHFHLFNESESKNEWKTDSEHTSKWEKQKINNKNWVRIGQQTTQLQ